MDRFALFPTPILVFEVAELSSVNPILSEALLEESQREPSIQRSNSGGWHSRPDLAQRSDPHFRALTDTVVRYVQQTFFQVCHAQGIDPPNGYGFSILGWAMVMRAGDYTILHDHAEAHWSVAYYVDAGDADDEESGLLAFVDPRRGSTAIPGVDLSPTTFTVRPKTGNLVVFPGWLQHYVHPYRGSRPRICVSCNVRMSLGGPGPQ